MRNIIILILLILFVFFGGTYLLYQWNPRSYAFFWPRIFAHVHPVVPGAPICVPKDLVKAGNSDFHDSWATPASDHATQHIEWLGKCVSEEAAARAQDTFDDGLRSIVFGAGGQWQPNSKFQLKILVNTAYSSHKKWFKNGNISLAVFADWNNNNKFQAAELIHSWVGNPPFNFSPLSPDYTLLTTPQITVPANYVAPGAQPKFRLRLVYVNGNAADVNPGGINTFGEVEDYGNEPVIEN